MKFLELTELNLISRTAADIDLLYSNVIADLTTLPGIYSVSLYLSVLGNVEATNLRSQKKTTISYPSSASIQTRNIELNLWGSRFGFVQIEEISTTDQNREKQINNATMLLSLIAEHEQTKLIETNLNARLEIYSKLNQIFSAELPLERLPTTVCRECAFRFSADCVLALFVGENEDSLEVKGSYGIAPQLLPTSISMINTFIGRTLRLGGIISLPDLSTKTDHGFDFLTKSGISSLHCCSLEVRGDTIGALLIGFKNPLQLNDSLTAMFKEFAGGTAIAAANARTQSSLKAYTEKLEQIVELRTADLAVQMSRAEEASRSKSRFVANMSHELRTPLTAIVGYSSVLADGIYGSVNEKQKDALQAITRSSEHLKELIDQILNLSRVEAGKEDPVPSKIELYAVLLQVHKLLLQTAISKGVKLQPLVLDEKLKGLKLWVDPRHIRQILINLLSNAVKYTQPGGTISVTAEIVADKVKICIKDTGVGIAPDLKMRLFDRFERGDNSYAKAQSGTGIGLSLTKHLVEINGGVIGIESEVSKGSTFWILIPTADVSSGANLEDSTQEEKQVTACRLDGLNILIVDDNQMTCEVLQTILQKAGASAYFSNTVASAKVLSKEVDFDAALIDLAMPLENGFELLSYFRKESPSSSRNIPLIVVSACVFDKDRQLAMDHGASYFIAKPFSPAEVVSQIRQLTKESVINSTGNFRAIRIDTGHQ